MTLFIDNREGSKELFPAFRQLSGCPRIKLCPGLPTDVMFLGNGPGGRKISIGIEHKTIPDALACILSGRYAGHQLIEQRNNFDEWWLMIEGIWKQNEDDGRLMLFRRGEWCDTSEAMLGSSKVWMWRDFMSWILTMMIIGRVKVWPTSVTSKAQSVRAIATLYHWWTKGEYEDHRSHLEVDDSGVSLTPKSTVFRAARALPGIDWVSAGAVEAEFGSLFAAANAGVGVWSEIKIGQQHKQKRRLGAKRAQRIVDAIHGKEEERV